MQGQKDFIIISLPSSHVVPGACGYQQKASDRYGVGGGGPGMATEAKRQVALLLRPTQHHFWNSLHQRRPSEQQHEVHVKSVCTMVEDQGRYFRKLKREPYIHLRLPLYTQNHQLLSTSTLNSTSHETSRRRSRQIEHHADFSSRISPQTS